MTNRWSIKLPNCTESFLYYADTEEIARERNPTAEKITPYTDTSYLRYISKILSVSKLKGYDYRGREVWIYPYCNCEIWVKLYKDKDGDYYDICAYQRQKSGAGISPITWTMINPKTFCENFGNTKSEQLPQGYNITPRDIKKMKATKFYNKNGEAMWVDEQGFFYTADKHDLPSFKKLQEYNTFKDNLEAVYVKFCIPTSDNPHGNAKYKWFNNEKSFLEYYNNMIKDCPSCYASPSYQILKCGYRKVNPADRKVILRLPYIDIDTEVRMMTPISDIVKMWSNLCDKRWFDNNFDVYDYLENILKIYIKWRSEKIEK